MENCRSTLCGICLNKTGNYVCPRCYISYCDLNCYKSAKHEDCSEAFYKEFCQASLKNLKANDFDKRHILTILQREQDKTEQDILNPDSDVEYLEDNVDHEESDLETRLLGIDLSTDDFDVDELWSRLTKREQRIFYHQLRSGELSRCISEWNPWWNTIVLEYPLSRLTKRYPYSRIQQSEKPDDFISYEIIDILLSYVILCRYYNGEYFESAAEVASYLINIPASWLFIAKPEEVIHGDLETDRLNDTDLKYENNSYSLDHDNDFNKLRSRIDEPIVEVKIDTEIKKRTRILTALPKRSNSIIGSVAINTKGDSKLAPVLPFGSNRLQFGFRFDSVCQVVASVSSRLVNACGSVEIPISSSVAFYLVLALADLQKLLSFGEHVVRALDECDSLLRIAAKTFPCSRDQQGSAYRQASHRIHSLIACCLSVLSSNSKDSKTPITYGISPWLNWRLPRLREAVAVEYCSRMSKLAEANVKPNSSVSMNKGNNRYAGPNWKHIIRDRKDIGEANESMNCLLSNLAGNFSAKKLNALNEIGSMNASSICSNSSLLVEVLESKEFDDRI